MASRNFASRGVPLLYFGCILALGLSGCRLSGEEIGSEGGNPSVQETPVAEPLVSPEDVSSPIPTVENEITEEVTAGETTVNVAPSASPSPNLPAPTLTGVSPGSGRLAGGGSLVLTGTDLTASVAAGSIKIGETSCPITAASATEITCTIPAQSAGVYDVTLTNGDGQSAKLSSVYRYNPIPTITGVSPTSASTLGGATITVDGTNFIDPAGITVGGVACATPILSSCTDGFCTRMTCVVPASSAGSALVAIAHADTQSATYSSFVLYDPPTISNVSPTNGKLAGGGTLVINGGAFQNGALVVKIGGGNGTTCTSPVWVSASQASCTLPAQSAGTYSVYLENPDGQNVTLDSAYTYNPVPTLSSITPASGPSAGGTTATLIGTGFLSGTSVTVGGTACATTTFVSATSITCVTPSGTAGAKDVVVTQADTQSVTSTGGFTFVAPPSLASVAPSNGKLAGGGTLSLSGTDFTATTSTGTVSVGGTDCDITAATSTSVSCTLPAKTAGTYAVVLTNADGQTSTLNSAYIYNPLPTISSITPNSGSTNGNFAVTLAGTGFMANPTVTIGGNACGSVSLSGSTQITCTAPAGSAGAVDAIVTNSDTQSVTSSGGFTYTVPVAAAGQSTISVSTPTMPHDGLATAVVIVVPRDSGGFPVGTGKVVEITVAGSGTASTTLTGVAACRTPASTCQKATDAGGGVYTATIKSSATYTSTLSAVVVEGSDVAVTQTASILWDTNQFSGGSGASLSANTTVDSTYAGKNLYITAGTITFDATAEGATFGHVVIRGGTVKHTATTTTAMRKLEITANSLTMTGGTIDASSLGYTNGYSYSSGGVPSNSAIFRATNGNCSHGGVGSGSADGDEQVTYGDYRDPKYPGCGKAGTGGGVVRITSSGSCVINSGAKILADASDRAAGGSIYLNCARIGGTAGSGAISAVGGYYGGGGGRIAFISSGDGASFFGNLLFPTSTSTLNTFLGSVTARGGHQYSTSTGGGAGSIFLKHSSLANGALIIANNGAGQLSAGTSVRRGYTQLVSLAGTVDGTPGANTLPFTATSSPAPSAGYANLYSGMKVRPDVSANGGTASDWSDDNLITVQSNTDSQLTSTANFSGVSNGSVFRSIDVLDYLEIVGALVQSNGDIYLTKGSLRSPGTSVYSTGGTFVLSGSAGFNYPGYANQTKITLDSGEYYAKQLVSTGSTLTELVSTGGDGKFEASTTLGKITIGTDGSYITFLSDVNVTDLATTTGGAYLYVNGTLTVANSFSSMGYLESPTITTPGSMTMLGGNHVKTYNLNAANLTINGNGSTDIVQYTSTGSGTVRRLNINLSGNFLLTGGKIDVSLQGYGSGANSYGANDTASTSLGSKNGSGNCGGGSHGGIGGGCQADRSDVGPVFDDYRDPNLPGGAGGNGGAGGGVVRLTAAGSCTINGGSITARGGGNGAGGSIYLQCASFAGTAPANTIEANGGDIASGTIRGGSGGRIALISTGGAGTFAGNLSIPTDAASLATFTGLVHARGGTSAYSMAAGGAGTLYYKHSGMTYGDLIIENTGIDSYTNTTAAGGTKYAGITRLPALAGTVSAVTSNTLTVSVTSTPGLTAAYTDLYKGLRIRPDISDDGGTATNWADDNILTVASNTDTTLTMMGNFTGVNVGDTFRSIDILDHIYIGSGAIVESYGDLFAVSGGIVNPGNATLTLGGIYDMKSGAQLYYPGFDNTLNLNHAGGSLVHANFASSGSTLSQFNVSSGTLYIPSSLDLGTVPLVMTGGSIVSSTGTVLTAGSFTLSGSAQLTAPTIVASGNITISTGTITTSSITANNLTVNVSSTIIHPASTATVANSLSINLSGNLTLSGNSALLSGRDRGYPTGYSFSATGPSTALASLNGAGASHGGQGGYITNATDPGATYDDFKDPALPGAGSATGAGGGVVRVTAAGNCAFSAGASIFADTWNAGAAGGSILLKCASFSTSSWTGAINANAYNASSTRGGGGGGRIAIISTGNSASMAGDFTFPANSTQLTTFTNKVYARGGDVYSTTSGGGGAGTVYVKHSGLTYGALIVDNNNKTVIAKSGTTKLVSSTANSSTLTSSPNGNTGQIGTDGATPLANQTDLYKNQLIHLFHTTGDSPDPRDTGAPHTFITLDSGNNENQFLTTTGPFPAITSDYYYRFLYRLDYLEVSRKATLDMNGADLWLEKCDLHSATSTLFDVAANNKLTGNSFSSPHCVDASVTTKGSTVLFTNYYLQ